MKNGPARFEFYLQPLEKLLADAAGQPDPALWLYQNNARTVLFMLEGLAKLYGNLHNKKRFAKIGMRFKRLEDALGSMDYYDGFAKQFAADATLSDASQIVAAKVVGKTNDLNALLVSEKWLGPAANRLAKIRNRLAGMDWLDDKSEIKAMASFYQSAIKKVNAFAAQYADGFTEIESQVHEIRRKLRWLSIYPQALQGCVQLSESPSNDPNVAKYLTEAVVNSPFNKMPPGGKNHWVLLLNKDYFLALSWMISELGRLKDDGLRAFLLDEIGQGPKTDGEADILAKASEICRTFFAEKNLDKLVYGVVRVDEEAAVPKS